MSTDHRHNHRHADHSHDNGHDAAHDHDHPGGIRGAVLGIFAPHSHDAADSIDSALESSERGIRAVKISFAALMVTAVIQLGVIVLSGSVALLADTIHNFSDALTAIPLFIAFRLARRAPTRRYTYGYGRAEDIAGLFVILMIALSAVIAAVEAIQRLISPEPINYVGWVALAGIIGFGGNELVALYRLREGRAIGSAALAADGYHARTDGFTALAVVLGAIGVWAGFDAADPIAGLVISAAIFAVLWRAATDVLRRLMNGVDPALVDRIEDKAERVPGVASVNQVQVRWEGHRLHADLAIGVPPSLPIAQAHRLAHAVEHELLHHSPPRRGRRPHRTQQSRTRRSPHRHPRPRHARHRTPLSTAARWCRQRTLQARQNCRPTLDSGTPNARTGRVRPCRSRRARSARLCALAPFAVGYV